MNGKRSDMAAYFEQLEEQIIQKLREETITPEGRQKLIHSTGVDDLELTKELVKLGIPADGVIALRLFPLVLVAWAEDSADESERETVMAEALHLGIQEASTAWILLKSWLKRRPPGLGVDAWKRYTHDIVSQMSQVAARKLAALTEKQMLAVAKSSGGHFGFGKVSKKEQAMIDRLLLLMQREVSQAK